jgi:hypothetical protein
LFSVNQNDESIGRKVLFLYPHSVIQDELVQLLTWSEYEVYLVRDHARVLGFLAQHPESVLFVNIDEVLSEPEWEQYVRKLRSSERTSAVQIGILSYNDDRALAEKYLMDIGVQCGFIRLKIGLRESSQIILKTLAAVEARGKRKYVRAKCDEKSATFNIRYMDRYVGGHIQDISSSGMAAVFDEPISLEPKSPLEDIQLKLRGKLLKVSGVVFGSRKHGGRDLYVVLFKTPPQHIKLALHNFIFQTLQANLERELKFY